jgi:hypothetical protein
MGSEEGEVADGVVEVLSLPPVVGGVWAALMEMLSTIANVVVQISFIRVPFG